MLLNLSSFIYNVLIINKRRRSKTFDQMPQFIKTIQLQNLYDLIVSASKYLHANMQEDQFYNLYLYIYIYRNSEILLLHKLY